MRPALLALAAVALALTGAVAARKKTSQPVTIARDAAPPAESHVDIEAKGTMHVIADVYPSLCQVDAATREWTTCREASTGYATVHACAEKGQREVRRALDALPPTTSERYACAEGVRTAAVLSLNTAPKFFGDLLAWMQDRHETLAPKLATKSLGEACRETPTLCEGEPHEWDDGYHAMRMRTVEKIDCTSRLFMCGRSDASECSLASIAPRLGVACQPGDNRRGASPEDLLYVRGTGTPLAR